MMNINNYFNFDNGRVTFTQQQGSSFAKGVAGDFNLIHDEGARRFCVPGDLLFAVFLSQYGISQKMKFEFSGMVTDTTALVFPAEITEDVSLQDEQGKTYMDIHVSGEKTLDNQFIATLSEQYVQFSGQTFPHILVSLMKQEGVMINPARPLVIYKNMEIHLHKLSGENIQLELKNSVLQAKGKKGEAILEFAILADGEEIGHGAKKLLLSGLREFDEAQLNEVVHSYEEWKSNYLSKA